MREIPFVDLKAGFKPVKEEVMQAIEAVLEGMQLNLGPNCQALEQEFAAYCGTRYAAAVASGTEALQFVLLACGVKPGDEVVTTPHTFFATAEAIACIGAVPVFADIDPATFNIAPAELRKKITSKTRAIIPVHMYGQTADMDSINAAAGEYGIPVIEDSCQAHGSLYNGRKSGSLGTAGCFSFYFTKNLGGYGEGGIVTTDDEGVFERVKLYRNHGHTSKYEHAVVGYNGRLDEMQAAILRIRLKRLEDYNTARRQKASLYNSLLADTPLMLPAEAAGRRHVYHLYVVRSKNRDALQEFLGSHGIGTGIHYKNPVHLQKALAFLGCKQGELPVAENICEEILSLPIYPELSDEDIKYVSDRIHEYYSSVKGVD